jgi:hypothetical protein
MRIKSPKHLIQMSKPVREMSVIRKKRRSELTDRGRPYAIG